MGICCSKNTISGHRKGNSRSLVKDNIITIEDTTEYVPQLGKCVVVKVYDGDTITVASKIPGDNTLYRFNIRFRGIDAPEIKPTNMGPTGKEEKEVAYVARDFLHNKIMNKIVKLENVGNEKYGRLLADVYCDGDDLAKCLLKERLAVPYGSSGPKSWAKYYSAGKLD